MTKSINASDRLETAIKPDFVIRSPIMSDVYGGDAYTGGLIRLKNKGSSGVNPTHGQEKGF